MHQGIYCCRCNITEDLDNTYSIRDGDIDGNGWGDIVVGNYGINKVYLNQGYDPLTSCIIWKTCTITSDNYDTSSILTADIDGDGNLDVISGNTNGPNKIYVNGGIDPSSGCIIWYGSNITDDDHRTEGLFIADMDKDGRLDIIVANYNQVNKIYLNKGYNPTSHSFTLVRL